MVKKGKGRIIGAAGYNPFRITESLRDIEKAVNEYGFKFVYVHNISFGIPFNDKLLYPLYGLCSVAEDTCIYAGWTFRRAAPQLGRESNVC